MRTVLFVAAVLAGSPPARANSPAPERPAKLGLCVSCHGVDGRAVAPGTPHLAGQDRIYLQKALSDYRSGARKSNPMNAIANTLQPREIEQMAEWYAAQKGWGAR